MIAQHFTQVCRLYDLGEWIRPARPVSGGLLHRMWHINTSAGQFAVKELNAEIMRRGPNMRDAYRLSEQIAARAAAAGIPSATALAVPHDPAGTVQNIDEVTVIVYNWIDGITLASDLATPAQTRRISQLRG